MSDAGEAGGDEATSPRVGLEAGDPKQVARVFRSLLARSDDVFGVFAGDGRVLYISPSVHRLLGFQPEELIGTPSARDACVQSAHSRTLMRARARAAGRVLMPADTIHPDDVPTVLEYARKHRQPFGAWEPIRLRRMKKDGGYVEVESAGSCDVRARSALRGGACRAPGIAAHLTPSRFRRAKMCTASCAT